MEIENKIDSSSGLIKKNCDYEQISYKDKLKISEYISDNCNDGCSIEKTMLEECKVSVVIPASKERKTILRTIKSLAFQENVDSKDYEVIIVVNNPGELLLKGNDENGSLYQKELKRFNDRFTDNQETIKLLNCISDIKNCEGIKMSEDEISDLNDIRKMGLKLFVLDKSTKTKTLPIENANVGGARNRGVAEAVRRFRTIGKNGIIAQSDADTRFDEKYISNLIDAFKEDKDLIGLVGQIQFEIPEEADEINRRSLVYLEMEYRYNRLVDFFLNERTKDLSYGDMRLRSDLKFTGANMASKAYESAIVGGVPKIKGGEDPQFGWNLSKIGKLDKRDNIKTYPLDRVSDRTDENAGVGQRKIRWINYIKGVEDLRLDNPEKKIILNKIFGRIVNLVNTKEVDEYKLCDILSIDDENGNNLPLLDNSDLEVFKEKLSFVKDLTELNDDSVLLWTANQIKLNVDKYKQPVKIEESGDVLLKLFFETNMDEFLGEYSKVYATNKVNEMGEFEKMFKIKDDKLKDEYLRLKALDIARKDYIERKISSVI